MIMLKAINIKWDTDGDEEVLQDLPTEMIIPEWLEEEYDLDDPYNEEISDWLSEEIGFCHYGFEIVKEVTKESVEEELYDFFNGRMFTGDAPEIESMEQQDDVIILNCIGGKQVKINIQVD